MPLASPVQKGLLWHICVYHIHSVTVKTSPEAGWLFWLYVKMQIKLVLHGEVIRGSEWTSQTDLAVHDIHTLYIENAGIARWQAPARTR